MQLISIKDGQRPVAVGALLSAATCGLLMATPVLASEGSDQPWRVDAGYMHYQENERISVNERKVSLRYQANEDNAVTVRYGYDAVSGSSPTGAVRVQSRSGASGAGYLAKFAALRTSFGADWDTAIDSVTRLSLGVDHSQQTAYESTGVGATLSRDFNQRNTTLVAGVGYSQDLVKPKAGLHYGMGWVSESKVWQRDDTKEQLDVQLGITQVLSRTTLAQLNFVRSRGAGYMTNPYKIISIVNPVTGSTGDYDSVYENRPRVRDMNAVYTQINQAFGHAVGSLSYRYFWDDWGIRSHTIEARYRQPLGERFYVQPHARYYQQTAADFYRSMLTTAEAGNLPQYASADYRLAKLHTTTLGVKLGYKITGGGEIGVRVETIRQGGEERPGDAVGVQRVEGVFPGMRARMVDISFTMPF